MLPYHLRSVPQLHEFFTGLELVGPGLVPVELWRPDPTTVGTLAEHTGDHAGLAPQMAPPRECVVPSGGRYALTRPAG